MSNRSEIEKQKAAWLELIDEGAVTPVAGDHVPFIDATDESLRVADATDFLGGGGGVITALNSAAENRMVTVGAVTTELDAESGLTSNGQHIDFNNPTVGGTRYGFRLKDAGGTMRVVIGLSTTGTDTMLNMPATVSRFVFIQGSTTETNAINTDGDLLMYKAAARIDFTGTHGGGNEGITYEDSGGVGRFGLIFPATNKVVLCNRASNGVVELRANTSTGGGGGEVTVVTVEDDRVLLSAGVTLLQNGTTSPTGTVAGTFQQGVQAGLPTPAVNAGCYAVIDVGTTATPIAVAEGGKYAHLKQQRQTITLNAAVTTFVATAKTILLSGDSPTGNTLATITTTTNWEPDELTIICQDALVTFTDTAAATANTFNLAGGLTSAANTVLVLAWNGTKWIEKSRSVN